MDRRFKFQLIKVQDQKPEAQARKVRTNTLAAQGSNTSDIPSSFFATQRPASALRVLPRFRRLKHEGYDRARGAPVSLASWQQGCSF